MSTNMLELVFQQALESVEQPFWELIQSQKLKINGPLWQQLHPDVWQVLWSIRQQVARQVKETTL